MFDAGYQRLAEALAKAKPDVSLIISADHVNKFFIDNMPAFGIGMFDEFSGPDRIQDQAVRRSIPPRAERFRLCALSGRARPRRGRGLGGDGELGGGPRLHGPAVPARSGGAVSGWCRSSSIARRRRCRARSAATRSAAGSPTSSAVGMPTSAWRSSPPAACRIRSARCSKAGSTRTSITASSRISAPATARLWRRCRIDEIAATGSATGEVRSWIVLAGAFAGRTAEQVMYEPIQGFDTGCAQCLIQ